jgi:hypothetical protein
MKYTNNEQNPANLKYYIFLRSNVLYLEYLASLNIVLN